MLRLITVLSAVLLAGASPAAAQAPETKQIRFVAVPSSGSSLVWIAAEKGFD